MTRILFWNIDGRPLSREIAHLCSHYRVDLLALAEPIDPAMLTGVLYESTGRIFFRSELAVRLHVYSALPQGSVTILFDRGGLVAVDVQQVIGPSLLILFAHLSSKMGQTEGGADMLATRARAYIEDLEQAVGHKRTLVIGDLNMDPYDRGVISSEAFHASMSSTIVARRTRVVHGEERSFFYNPMWNFLGDQTPGPPGTFYRNKSESNAYYWHMLDQVLIRPDALNIVNAHSITIVRDADDLQLHDDHGHPSLSDHFPLLVITDDPLPSERTNEASQEDRK